MTKEVGTLLLVIITTHGEYMSVSQQPRTVFSEGKRISHVHRLSQHLLTDNAEKAACNK